MVLARPHEDPSFVAGDAEGAADGGASDANADTGADSSVGADPAAAAVDANTPDAPAAPAPAPPPSLVALLNEHVAPSSRTGACAPFYASLKTHLAPLVAGKKRVDAAVRTLVDLLPAHPCRATPEGTWALAYDEVSGALIEPAEDAQQSAVDYPSFHVVARGRLIFVRAGDASPPAELPFALDSAPLLSIATDEGGFSAVASTIEDLEVGDVDGDQLPELLVKARRGTVPLLEGGDTRAHLSALYRVSAGSIAPLDVAPAGIAFTHLVDGDGDGRFDLTSPLPYFGLDDGNLGDIEIAGPDLLFHGRTEGGFSRSDDAARAWARKICPSRPALVLALLDGPDSADAPDVPVFMTDAADAVIHDTVCARLWGVSEADLRHWLDTLHGGKQLTRWVSLPPPLSLAH